MRIYTHGGGGSGQVVVDTAPPHCCQIWFVSGCSGLYTVLYVSSPESGHRPQEPELFEPSMQPSPGSSGHSPVLLLSDLVCVWMFKSVRSCLSALTSCVFPPQNHHKASAHQQDVPFIHFDYHSEIKGTNLKNLERLKARIIKQIKEFDFFYSSNISSGEAQR